MRRVSKSTYKKYFLILMAVFACMFVAELVSILMGKPITEIYISGVNLERDMLSIKLFRSFLSACFVGSYFNFFFTVKIIKEARNIDRLPTPAIVIMTLLFPLEIIISGVLVVPDILFWGIKGFISMKSKVADINKDSNCFAEPKELPIESEE